MKYILDIVRERPFPKEMSYSEIRIAVETNRMPRVLREWFSINIESNWFCICKYEKVITFVGNKAFPKTNKMSEFCKTKTGRYYGTPTTITEGLLKFLGKEWTNELPSNFTCKKEIMSQILLGKYTNPEDITKAYIKAHYKGCFVWRDVLEFYRSYLIVSLSDIMTFTTNPNICLHKIMENVHSSYTQELLDTIKLATLLDTKVNPLWSEKRLREEHTNQNRLLNKAKLEAVPSTPIYPKYITDMMQYKGIELINSERECLDLALEMNNCLHTIHWSYLKAMSRIAFRFTTSDEIACVEYRIQNDGNIVLNEARGKNNKHLLPATQEHIDYICKGFNMKQVGKAINEYYASTHVVESPAAENKFEVEIPW